MKYFIIFFMVVGLVGTSFASESTSTNYFLNPDFQIYKIKEKNYEFFLPYDITNSKIQNMTLDCQSKSMIINLESARANGNLTISIPRSLLDIKTQTGDEDFFVLVDGSEVNYSEIEKNQDARTLSIPFTINATVIEIIGVDTSLQGEQTPVPNLCGIGGTEGSPYYHLLSPLKQFKSGILSTDVKCNDGFLLTFKANDGYPTCVKPDTKIQLLKIGWAMPGPKDFGYNPGRGPLAFHDPKSNGMDYHGLPTSPDITILYNGTTLSDNVIFYVKQGQNMTLMLDVKSNPVNNIPVTLYTAPHNGFTKTNGIDFKLSDTMVNTPAKVMLYISVSKDATPSTYGATVKENNTDSGSVTYRFFVTVK